MFSLFSSIIHKNNITTWLCTRTILPPKHTGIIDFKCGLFKLQLLDQLTWKKVDQEPLSMIYANDCSGRCLVSLLQNTNQGQCNISLLSHFVSLSTLLIEFFLYFFSLLSFSILSLFLTHFSLSTLSIYFSFYAFSLNFVYFHSSFLHSILSLHFLLLLAYYIFSIHFLTRLSTYFWSNFHSLNSHSTFISNFPSLVFHFTYIFARYCYSLPSLSTHPSTFLGRVILQLLEYWWTQCPHLWAHAVPTIGTVLIV